MTQPTTKTHSNQQICHDCSKELQKGDEFMRYDGTDKIKCRECYEKDSILKDYQPCDVYSRVVGFHSPVSRWNKGKSEEWKERKTFKIKE